MKRIEVDRSAVYELNDAAKLCGLAAATLRRAAQSNELPTTKRGRRYFIDGDRLWRWLTGRPQGIGGER
jgi:hypothetical protein